MCAVGIESPVCVCGGSDEAGRDPAENEPSPGGEQGWVAGGGGEDSADVGAIGDVAKSMAPTDRGSWRGELRKRMAWKGETGDGCEDRTEITRK